MASTAYIASVEDVRVTRKTTAVDHTLIGAFTTKDKAVQACEATHRLWGLVNGKTTELEVWRSNASTWQALAPVTDKDTKQYSVVKARLR